MSLRKHKRFISDAQAHTNRRFKKLIEKETGKIFRPSKSKIKVRAVDTCSTYSGERLAVFKTVRDEEL
jgi:hypothetical protein